jgi:hypothetical protein
MFRYISQIRSVHLNLDPKCSLHLQLSREHILLAADGRSSLLSSPVKQRSLFVSFKIRSDGLYAAPASVRKKTSDGENIEEGRCAKEGW